MLEPELDVSGRKAERPILDDMIARIRAGEVEGVIVAQLDRFSRLSIEDALKVIREIEAPGGQVISVAENFDASTPEGRFSRATILSVGAMQWEQHQARFRHVKRRAVERGVWPTKTPPIGYRIGEDRRLAVDPDTGPAVVRAFERRAAGDSWRQVGELIGRGTSGARKVITNRVYLGELRLRDKVDGVWVNAEAHEPLVSRALWEAAQLAHPAPAKGRRGPALLRGLVRCAACQRTMNADQANASPGYRCRRHFAGESCPNPAWIGRDLVDAYVEGVFLDHLTVRHETVDDSEDLARAERVLDNAEAELAGYQEATRIADIGAEHFAAGMQTRVAAVEQARADVGRLRGARDRVFGTLAEQWDDLGVEERGHVLRGALGVVWVRAGRGLAVAERVKVIAAGFEFPDLPRAGWGKNTPIRDFAWVDLEGELRPLGVE